MTKLGERTIILQIHSSYVNPAKKFQISAKSRISLNVSNKIGGGYDHLADSLIICQSGEKIPDFGEIAYLFES